MPEVTLAGLAREAEELAARLPAGATCWLEGELGAGKTTFARALVRARGGGDVATSPTYALVHRYDGPRGPIVHVDCYRLRSAAEAEELDWPALREGADLLLVEWPARAYGVAPPPDARVRLAHVADPDRRALEVG